jgi:hypothetical protein
MCASLPTLSLPSAVLLLYYCFTTALLWQGEPGESMLIVHAGVVTIYVKKTVAEAECAEKEVLDESRCQIMYFHTSKTSKLISKMSSKLSTSWQEQWQVLNLLALLVQKYKYRR